MNIIEYVATSQESFTERPLGEADSLVLCQIAYMHLHPCEGAELSRLFELCQSDLDDVCAVQRERNELLLRALAESDRFGSVRLLEQRTVFDVQRSCQFSATLFGVGDVVYLACRGTDGTLVGWKENLDLMYKEDTAAQSHALEWLDSLNWAQRIVVGGHSKGGNIALYAAAFCRPDIQSRIEAVYNHDGPGFMPAVLLRDGYRTIVPRVHKTVPEMCVFGHILSDGLTYEVIKADSGGIYQHLSFNWQVMPDGTFVRGKGLTVRSQILREICNTAVPAMTMEERQIFVTTIYEALRHAEVNRVGEIASMKSIGKVLQYNRTLPKPLRATVGKCVRLFLSAAVDSSFNATEEHIGATRNEWRARRQESKQSTAEGDRLSAESPALIEQAAADDAVDTDGDGGDQ